MSSKQWLQRTRNDVARAIAVSERKNSLKTFDFFRFAVRMNVKRRASDDKTKHTRQIAGK